MRKRAVNRANYLVNEVVLSSASPNTLLSDVLPEMHAFKANLLDARVSSGNRPRQVTPRSRHAEHSPPRCLHATAASSGAGVKYRDTQLLRLFDSIDRLPHCE